MDLGTGRGMETIGVFIPMLERMILRGKLPIGFDNNLPITDGAIKLSEFVHSINQTNV